MAAPEHPIEDDFQHFLAYTSYGRLSAEEIERLRHAYQHGDSRRLNVMHGRLERERDELLKE